MKKETDFPQWYIDEAIPRLKRMEELVPLCAFDKWPAEKTEDERKAYKEWEELKNQQMKAEIEAGL